MRKLPSRPVAPVFELAAKRQMKPRLEVGIDAERGGIYIETSARYMMNAEQAETLADAIYGFVRELRNGGQLA